MKQSWIPTPLVTERKRPRIAPIRPPSRARPLLLAFVLGTTLLRLFWMRLTRRGTERTRALLIRAMLERLGGLWIKVGQLLGMRRDLFSPDFCDVLSALQDHATGFDFAYTREVIENDLGRRLEDIFSEFEEEPFAAASIGQIHRAVLRREGINVAVKVRRPTIAATVAGDIRFVTLLCNTAVRVGFFPSFRWQDFQRELDRTLSEELDYRFEATAIRDMRRNLKRHGLYAPKVFRDHLSERVLVMEFVRGALMSDVLRLRHLEPERLDRWLTENNIDRSKVGRRLFLSLARQIFEDNYFHGDLHPGNIVLLRDSRIALIDFGSVGWLEADFLQQYNDLQYALARQQYAKAADLFLLLAPELPPIDLEPCKTELATFMRNWALRARTPKLPFSQKSVGYAYGEMSSTLTRYRIPATWAFLRINRAQFTLDTSLRELYPEMDYFKLMRRYNEQAGRRRARRAFAPAHIGRQAADLLIDLPGLVKGAVEESFYDLEYVRRRARTFQSTATKAAMLGGLLINFVTALVIVGGVLLAMLYLHQTGRALPVSPELTEVLGRVPKVPPEGWLLMGGFVLVTIWQAISARRRFSQPDIEIVGSTRR